VAAALRLQLRLSRLALLTHRLNGLLNFTHGEGRLRGADGAARCEQEKEKGKKKEKKRFLCHTNLTRN
jgi:hypothetical protein